MPKHDFEVFRKGEPIQHRARQRLDFVRHQREPHSLLAQPTDQLVCAGPWPNPLGCTLVVDADITGIDFFGFGHRNGEFYLQPRFE